MYKLIIVDDEEKILEGIAGLFPWANIGFEVVGKYTNATEALIFCDTHEVDVVMTDIAMPDISGIILAQKLRKLKDITIVFFSSYQDYEYMREAIQQGIEDYLLKPINYDELMNCYEKIRERLEDKYGTIEEQPKDYYKKIVGKVDAYLEENYMRATLATAAELVGLSSNYLSKIYKEKAEVGFLDRLNMVRMQKASELLMNTNYKNYEIAYYIGYDNPKNFTRAFKAYYQVTPREYRNGIRKELDS